jgi:ABC-type antimicrobial peptide transport system permease subunit
MIVVGVVKDYHFRSLKEEIAPHVFQQDSKTNVGQIWVRIVPNDIPGTLTLLKNTVRQAIPSSPFEYAFADVAVMADYAQEARWKQVIQYAAIISAFISCMGLFGLSTLVIGQRTREIAIRKVMGAPVATIISHLSGGFLQLTFLAFMISIPAGRYATDQWLGRFAYRVEIGWWVYAVVGVISLLIAFITISFQSIRAAQANPVNSLNQQ